MAVPSPLPVPGDVATDGVWGSELNDAIASLHLGPDTHANIPAANAVPPHSLYYCTTHGAVHRSDGSTTWTDYFVLSSGGSATSPLDPAAPADTFGGTALPAGWSLAGSYVAGDYTVGNGFLKVTTGRAAGSYFYRAAPAGDFTATMRAYFVTPNSVMAGIICVDATGAGVGAGWYNSSPDAMGTGSLSGGAYNSASFQSDSAIKGSLFSQGVMGWYRLRKSGTSYYTSLSANGVDWSQETPAMASGFTPARLGFGTFYGTPTRLGVDWFDVV